MTEKTYTFEIKAYDKYKKAGRATETTGCDLIEITFFFSFLMPVC